MSLWVGTGNPGSRPQPSVDGFIWTGSSGKTFSGSQGFGVAWNGDYFIANGPTTILKSSDGSSWTKSSTQPFSGNAVNAAWNESLSLWVAVGNGTNTIVTSSDGETWTPRGSSPFTSGNGVGAKNNQSPSISIVLSETLTDITKIEFASDTYNQFGVLNTSASIKTSN